MIKVFLRDISWICDENEILIKDFY